jgi:hypothetical protein
VARGFVCLLAPSGAFGSGQSLRDKQNHGALDGISTASICCRTEGSKNGSRRPRRQADRAGAAALRVSWPTAAALVAALAAIAAVLLQLPGFNGPAEWRWPYRPLGLAPVPLVLALLFAAALIAILVYGPAGRRGAWSLALLGYGFSLSVIAAQPGGFGRVVSVLASRHSFSYLYDAALAPPARDLLADFPAASAELSMHSRTHPPGVLLAIRGLDQVARTLGPAGALRAPLPKKSAGAMELEISRAKERGKPGPAIPPSPFTGVLLAFLLPLAAAATALPLFALAVGWGLPEDAARWSAALWLTVPAGVLFTPSVDQALGLVVVVGAVLAAGAVKGPKGLQGPQGQPGWRAMAGILGAGIVVGLGCLISYGLLVAVPFVAWVAFSAGGDPWLSPRRFVRAALVGAGFALPWLALALFAGYDPWTSFRTAISAHAQMAVATRSYAIWLLGNPYDFALFCGPAVAVLGLVGLVSRRGPVALRRGLWGGAVLFALLWLSGSVRGEVGRIWLFAMPFVALAAAAAIERTAAGNRERALLVAAQALTTIALAASMIFVD